MENDGAMTADSTAPETASGEANETEREIETTSPESEDDSGQAEEFDEIEFNGKRYQVPKELKPGWMMQSDYTKKTQELADQRKALDSDRDAARQQVEAQRQHIRNIGKIEALNERLEAFQKVDWDRWFEADFMAAQKGRLQYDRMKDARDQLINTVREDERKATEAAREELGKRLQEGHDVLRREGLEMTPETEQRLRGYGKSRGLTDDEMSSIVDPRFMLILHDAEVGRSLREKQKAAAKAAQQPTEPIKPMAQVARGRTGTPPAGLSDRLSTDEWMKRRNAQLQ